MQAKFIFVKYTGKDSDFGTEVSSIGLKRVDAAVPAVYGNPVLPGDDTSDSMMYSVYRPDVDDAYAYSFESVFKLKLTNQPDNQLSNMRIYPVGEIPNDPKLPKLYIGCVNSYTRPTNSKSIVAVHDIWSFSASNPFKISVGGVSGTVLNPQVSYSTFNLTLGDIGSGNVMYLNNERQDLMQIVQPRPNIPDRQYVILDRTNGAVVAEIYNPIDNSIVTHPSIQKTVDGNGRSLITITANAALLSNYPNGLLYGSDNDISIGGVIEWIDLDGDPSTTEIYDIIIDGDRNGDYSYCMNTIQRPVINFDLNKKYVFNNRSGDTNPLRFIFTDESLAVESNIVVCKGVEIKNGGTVNEIITVDPRIVKDSGYVIHGYQSTKTRGIGGSVTNVQTNYVGAYNISTIGGGTNPSAAGETDFIYLQLAVRGDASVGNFIPELAIEYDEN